MHGSLLGDELRYFARFRPRPHLSRVVGLGPNGSLLVKARTEVLVAPPLRPGISSVATLAGVHGRALGADRTMQFMPVTF